MAVRIGIMSSAHIHAASYMACINQHPNAILVGVADDNAERGKQAAADFDTKFFQSYEALVQADIDAVVVTPENIKHREFTLMAAKAGKHVLCEKPLAVSVAEGRAMIEGCRQAGVQLMTAFPCRFSPAANRLKQAVESGAIGEVLAMKGTNRGWMPGMWFIELEKSGGGAVIDHTVHVADLMRWVTKKEPVEVYAEISNSMYHQAYDDCGMLTITFEGGVFSTLDTSWTKPRTYPMWGDVTLEVTGTEGVVTMDMFAQNIIHYNDEKKRVDWVFWGDNIDYGLVDSFVTAVAEDKPVPITGEDGLRAVEVALGAYKSRDTGMPVRLPME